LRYEKPRGKEGAMDYPQFRNMVRDRAGIAAPAEAEGAICATLKTLAERILRDKAELLADRVPPEFAECLREEQYGRQFGINEFYKRVADREGTSPEVAAEHARAVIDVLKQEISMDEMMGIISELPSEYSELFRMPQVQTVR
jgi:uncharacterized protein (DUF2267 family)